jgi:hypothetical protein
MSADQVVWFVGISRPRHDSPFFKLTMVTLFDPSKLSIALRHSLAFNGASQNRDNLFPTSLGVALRFPT